MSYAEKRDGKLTGHWYGEVVTKTDRFRRRFETKKAADGYEAYVRAAGEEPPGLDENLSGRTFKVVAEELKAAGGPDGTWAKGKDPSVIARVDFVCSLRFGALPIEQVTFKKAEELVADLKRRPGKVAGELLSGHTINRYLTAISSVMAYAERAEYVQGAPQLPWQKGTKKRQGIYTDTQRKAVLGYMRGQGWHDEAFIFEVLDRTGFRTGELDQLTEEQIEDEFIHLDDPERIKNEETRLAYVGPEMARELRALLRSGRMPKRRQVWNRVTLAVKACGYNIPRPLYAIRHTAATRTVNAEHDIQVAQQLLGHKSIKTTLGYRQVSRDVLKERAKKLHPRGGELASDTSVPEVVQFKKPA